MDTRVTVICPSCKDEEMEGWGGSVGGRIMSWKKKCPKCELVLLIVPMRKEYEYSLSATTPEERKELAIKKLKEENEIELARRITQIKDRDY